MLSQISFTLCTVFSTNTSEIYEVKCYGQSNIHHSLHCITYHRYHHHIHHHHHCYHHHRQHHHFILLKQYDKIQNNTKTAKIPSKIHQAHVSTYG